MADTADTLSRQSLHLQLVDRLQDMIVRGELQQGAKVPERDLCERFAVSRTPMREALKVLAAEGLVRLEPNRGAWVTSVTLAELEDVFPVMGALEALSGELACERITEAQLAGIKTLHHRMLDAYKQRDLPNYFRINQSIHAAILEAAGNETLAAQYRLLDARIRRARYLANMSETRWHRAVDEHRQILAALEVRNGKRLSSLLRAHVAGKLETVRAWLASEAANST